jgi:hypothetical protein
LIRRFCWYDRAADLQRFHQLPVVMVCALLVGKIKSGVQLKLSEPLCFPKRNAVGKAGIGFEIAFINCKASVFSFAVFEITQSDGIASS